MKKQLAITFILAAVLVIAGCTSNNSNTSTSVSSAQTTTVSGVPTTVSSSFSKLTFLCSDMISEAKLTELLSGLLQANQAFIYLNAGSVPFNSKEMNVAGDLNFYCTLSKKFGTITTLGTTIGYEIYSSSEFDKRKQTLLSLNPTAAQYHETNKVGTASYDNNGPGTCKGDYCFGQNMVVFIDDTGKYTVVVHEGENSLEQVSTDVLYQMADEINKNTGKIQAS